MDEKDLFWRHSGSLKTKLITHFNPWINHDLSLSTHRRFRDNFEKFIVNVRGFLLVKWCPKRTIKIQADHVPSKRDEDVRGKVDKGFNSTTICEFTWCEIQPFIYQADEIPWTKVDHLKRASSPSVFIPVQMLCDNSVKENKSSEDCGGRR